MVYFSEREASGKESADSRELVRMERFKRELARNALLGNYSDLKEFEGTVRKDLALIMLEVAGPARTKR